MIATFEIFLAVQTVAYFLIQKNPFHFKNGTDFFKGEKAVTLPV